jgi:hypothetical protein
MWLHALAIGYAPQYHAENEDAGRFGFARIPLPCLLTQLRDGAVLGEQVAGIVDVDMPLTPPGASAHAFWSRTGSPSARDSGRGLSPEDLPLQAWAVVQPAGVFPTDGLTVTRPLSDEELSARQDLADALGRTLGEVNGLLGDQVMDVAMNATAAWRSVPVAVWNIKIGGYSVLRKWLSYRDEQVLDRPMTVAEARGFADIVRRLTSLALLGPDLDAHYLAIAEASYAWT